MSEKGDIELEETAAQMMRQERAVFEMTRRQTKCEIGDKIPLDQKRPDILLKCYKLQLSPSIESPQRLWLYWQLDHKSKKPVLGWTISKENDQ